MRRGPRAGAASSTDFLARAVSAWGEPTPPEVVALAEACAARTARAVSGELGYSPAVISHVLAAKYPGDTQLVFAKIRGALMGETVSCPVLGEIGRDRCLAEQKRPFSAANPARVRLHRACPRCPNRREVADV
jgi:hypothetical protein